MLIDSLMVTSTSINSICEPESGAFWTVDFEDKVFVAS